MLIWNRKLKIFIRFCLLSLSLLVVSMNYAFALYPDAQGYVYKKKALDVYVGLGYSAIVSETFKPVGNNQMFQYGSLIDPMNQLANTGLNAVVGIRLFDNSGGFLSNFRMEGESLYFYNMTDVIDDATLHTSDVDTTDWPPNGQEVLKQSFVFNIYYDFRQISQIAYPYIGLGVGMGQVKYLAVDVHMQPNGIGERYHGEGFVPLTQLILGFQYDTKIIKSSFFIQYRVIKGGKITATPLNNGTDNIKEPDSTGEGGVEIPADYESPKPIDLGLLNHGITIGFKYYLY